jgi:hypothetical protein
MQTIRNDGPGEAESFRSPQIATRPIYKTIAVLTFQKPFSPNHPSPYNIVKRSRDIDPSLPKHGPLLSHRTFALNA